MDGIDRSRSTCRLVTVTNELQNRITQKKSMYPLGLPKKVILSINLFGSFLFLLLWPSTLSSNLMFQKLNH